MTVSRRTLLLGGLAAAGTAGAVVATATEAAPVRSALLGRIGRGPHVESGAFTSRARLGARTGWTLALPPGVSVDRPVTATGAPLPLCVILHGKGGDHTELGKVGYDAALAAVVRSGVPPFALVSVDGGNRYWHRRAEGDDSGAMVLGELLPLMARRGLAAGEDDAVAFLGWSMGGYGSMLTALRRGLDRVAGVAAISPALWLDPGSTPAGAFDDREDYDAHDVWGRRDELATVPLRLDCGDRDAFLPAFREFVAGTRPRPAGGVQAGRHNRDYWRSLAPAQLTFLGRALAARAG